MPSLCPVCGRIYCDHTPEQRGQTHEEMMRNPTEEERRMFEKNASLPSGQPDSIALAKKNAHLKLPDKKD